MPLKKEGERERELARESREWDPKSRAFNIKLPQARIESP